MLFKYSIFFVVCKENIDNQCVPFLFALDICPTLYPDTKWVKQQNDLDKARIKSVY